MLRYYLTIDNLSKVGTLGADLFFMMPTDYKIALYASIKFYSSIIKQLDVIIELIIVCKYKLHVHGR